MEDLAQIDALLAFAAGKKTLRLEHFHPQNAITLPRQARDKQREGTQKREWRFLVGLNLGQGMGFVFLDKRVSTELWLTKQFRGKETRPSAPCMRKRHLFTKTGSGPT
jgi:hypothetical protein